MRKRLVVLGAALSATVSACALYEAPKGAPTLPIVNEFANTQIANTQIANTEATSASESVSGAWWRGFDDSALNDLIDAALRHNADVRIALANVNAARALRGLQRWEYMPTGGVDVGFERGRTSLSASGAERYEIASAYIGASWELDLFGRVLNANRVAEANRIGAEAAFDGARLLVASETAATYFRLRASDRKIASRVDALTQQQRIVEITRAMVDENRIPPDALERALAEQANDETALLREREERRAFEHRLAVLVGQQPGHWRLPATTDDRVLELRPAYLGDVDALLRHRPDVRIATQTLVARQAAVKMAQAAYFPRVSLTGAVGYAAGGFGNLGDTDSQTWSVMPAIQWNVLDFGRNAKRVKANEAQVDRETANFERTVLRAIEDTENALARYATAQRELILRERAHRHSMAAAEAANARYEEGMAPYLEALHARRDAVSAAIARADSIADQRLANIGLFTALGIAP